MGRPVVVFAQLGSKGEGGGAGGPGEEGVVEDVNVRTVVIRTHDGERLFVPSSTVLREPIRNLTVNGSRRTVLSFCLPFATGLASVCRTLGAAVQAAPGVHEQPAVLVQVKGVGEAGVELTMKFWHDPGVAATHAATDAAASAAMAALAAFGVEPEVPQRRVLDSRAQTLA